MSVRVTGNIFEMGTSSNVKWRFLAWSKFLSFYLLGMQLELQKQANGRRGAGAQASACRSGAGSSVRHHRRRQQIRQAPEVRAGSTPSLGALHGLSNHTGGFHTGGMETRPLRGEL